jgi:Fur family ferric uptake transcriptional regulator
VTRAPERPALDFGSVEDILATLRAAGHRVSAPAARLLDVLFSADGPVSADHIAGADPNLERTSVYRNLERLEALGVVSHVHVGHGPGLYALARGVDREYLSCDRCGRVTIVDPAALDGVRAALRADFGHHARFSHFPIHGLCASCAQTGDSMSTPDHEHEHSHGGHVHSHPHSGEDHEHVEHEHEHSHGDFVHSHPHVHEEGLEHEHEHEHQH